MNIIGRRKLWYTISGILIIPGIIALFLWGLRPGIDFKGGTLIEMKFSQNTSVQQVQKALAETEFKNATIQTTSEGTILVRLEPINQDQHLKLKEGLAAKIGEGQEIRFETVGPTVSSDLTRKAVMALILASFGIIIYLAYAFRQLPRPASSWRFGVCAVIALIHDLVFITGLWAILGHYYGFEIDSLFITALLTIMGFSVHDTIVVFDRIRENLRKHPSLGFEENANNSIIQTLNRSLNTSLTVLIVLASLYFLGGVTLQHFVLMLLIGITIGTYSSIFNAAPLLVTWQGWISNRLTKKDAS